MSSDPGMKQHLDKLRLKFPNLDDDIPHLVRLVNEIRIYRLLGEFELELHSVIS
jgi:hypothetical protein